MMAGALAYTPAGFGVPEVGGALAGPSAVGGLGLPTNPAAAHPPSIEVAIDGAAMFTRLYAELAAAPGDAIDNAGVSPVPFLGAAFPYKKVGFGISVFVPIARGTKPGSPDSAMRFHSVAGGFQTIEADLSFAGQVHPAWTLGGSFRVGYTSIRSAKAMDSGAILTALLGPDAGVPFQDPLLEGYQQLDPQGGVGFGGSLGFRFQPKKGPHVHLSVRSPMPTTISGGVTVIPSTALDLALTGTVTSEMLLPFSVHAAIVAPLPWFSIVLDGSWIGWSTMASFDSQVTDLEISSPDSTMQGILQSYGVTEGEFLDAAGGARSVSAMRDTVNVGLTAVVPVMSQLEARAGIWYLPASVPDSHVHPGNLDFTAVNLRGAVAWTPIRQLTVALSGDWYYNAPRTITTSRHDPRDVTSSGVLLPSGNGTYALNMSRVGLTVVARR